jgi:hypothetical protein
MRARCEMGEGNTMRSNPRLAPANAALVALYFVPVWGTDAVKALMSPFGGFQDRAHAAVAVYFRQIFDLGLDGLVRTSAVLAGIKLVIAVGFVAYLIEFVRAVVMDREPNRETLDLVLLLALGAVLIWALPALTLGDPAVTRTYASQFLLLLGAVVVTVIERSVADRVPADRTASLTMLAHA